MKFVGIDPGEKGAIAFLHEDGSLDKYISYPDVNMKRLIAYLSDRKQEFKVVIEKLWASPIKGKKAAWTQAENYGAWKLALALAEVSNVEIAPVTWQKLILNTSKHKAGETKPLSLKYVNNRYQLHLPSKTLSEIAFYSGVSDGICLALYSRHLHLNRL